MTNFLTSASRSSVVTSLDGDATILIASGRYFHSIPLHGGGPVAAFGCTAATFHADLTAASTFLGRHVAVPHCTRNGLCLSARFAASTEAKLIWTSLRGPGGMYDIVMSAATTPATNATVRCARSMSEIDRSDTRAMSARVDTEGATPIRSRSTSRQRRHCDPIIDEHWCRDDDDDDDDDTDAFDVVAIGTAFCTARMYVSLRCCEIAALDASSRATLRICTGAVIEGEGDPIVSSSFVAVAAVVAGPVSAFDADSSAGSDVGAGSDGGGIDDDDDDDDGATPSFSTREVDPVATSCIDDSSADGDDDDDADSGATLPRSLLDSNGENEPHVHGDDDVADA